jgi:hypothetical protein
MKKQSEKIKKEGKKKEKENKKEEKKKIAPVTSQRITRKRKSAAISNDEKQSDDHKSVNPSIKETPIKSADDYKSELNGFIMNCCAKVKIIDDEMNPTSGDHKPVFTMTKSTPKPKKKGKMDKKENNSTEEKKRKPKKSKVKVNEEVDPKPEEEEVQEKKVKIKCTRAYEPWKLMKMWVEKFAKQVEDRSQERIDNYNKREQKKSKRIMNQKISN